MDSRQYTFNKSTLTVKFGNIIDTKTEVIDSSVNSNTSINVVREIGYAVNMNKPILPLMLDDAPYAKSIRLDISDIDQIDFKNPIASSKKLITSLMYVLNK